MTTLVPAPTAATPDPDDAPYYAAGSQYTARYDQTRNTWRLLPVDGPDLVIDAGDCSTGATASPGLWLLAVDAEGRISNESPVGRALLGKKKGEKVVVKVPAGDFTYKIVGIT